MEGYLWVAVFWLSALSMWLGWKVLVLRRTVRQMLDWQRLAMKALENVFTQPRTEDDDSILDSEVIQ